MFADPIPTERINSFALVSYIPEPLSGFLNRLRQELVPNCFLRAHVTVLPPRPASAPWEIALEQIREAARSFGPFDVTVSGVEVFPVSDVIFISVGKGEQELRHMHSAMNAGGLKFHERYPYHPHITLAQDLKCDELDELVHAARTRWPEFEFPRTFRVETLTFVQATRYKTWVDLGECPLSGNVASGL